MGKREQFDIPDISLCIKGEGIISNKEMLQTIIYLIINHISDTISSLWIILSNIYIPNRF